MRSRSVLAAAVLIVTGVVVARATKPSPTASPAARAETAASADAVGSPPESASPAPSAPPSPRVAALPTAPSATAAENVTPEHADAVSIEPARKVRPTETLITELGSSDPFVVLEAANGLAKRKATRAIPTLGAIDIRKNAQSAPSVIAALGGLASVADPAARKTAADRLLELLAQERVRRAPETAGNVLALYAALGQTSDPRAATALEAELVDPKVTLAAKVVVVEALVRLKQPSSGPPLRALQRELSVLVAADPLEEEIRRELTVAVAQALQS